MSGLTGNPLFLASAAAGGYNISRSLRFNSADSAYLSRTPASAGNRKTWTWAGWVKRSALGSIQALMTVEGNSDSTTAQFWFSSDDKFRFGIETADIFITNAVFRDCSAWYHIVFAFDATNATSADKMILYVNGVRQTTSTYTAPSNTDYGFNRASAIHSIGRRQNNADWYLNGYLADVYLIDGQQLTPSAFGEFSATTGVWVPNAFSGGSYGTNGAQLKFEDNSSNTATTLGKDTSGNGNNWTPNNLSVTAGAGNDSVVDVPTNGSEVDTGLGNQVRGNYATLNPLFVNAGTATLTNGNLDYTTASGSYATRISTIGVSSGKWYAEFTFTTVSGAQLIGVANNPSMAIGFLGESATNFSYAQDGKKYTNGGGSAYGSSYTTGDVVGIALDLDAGTLVFYKNGVSQGTAFSSLSAGTYFFGLSGTSGTTGSWNFGQRPFAYPVAGYKSLNTASLPASVVTKPSTVMDVKLYTGNGSTQTISGLGFSPDFVWVKKRNATANHFLADTVRGTTKALLSDATDAEYTNANYITAFNSDGFSVGSDSGYNANGDTYAAWTWDAGNTTVTNTQGSITSSVRANPSAGFSVVTYTGNGANATVGHGLGVAPSMVIVKVRNRSGDNWLVYHKSLTTPATDYLFLSSTAAAGTLSTYWNGGPTSSVIGLGNYSAINNNSDNYVAYCFAPVAGYSSFGSYVGNGSSTDNTFVYTGMRPRFVMLKRSDSTGNWVIWDAVRNSYNVANSILLPNSSAAEFSPDAKIDILSNGFKVRDNSSDSGSNGGTYIYAAFAESPFAANNRAR